MSTFRLKARWVFPGDRPPLRDGVVCLQGDRIASVHPANDRSPDRVLGNVALLPGLVNAHTHLDLTGLRGCCPPSTDFTAWLRGVIRHRLQRSAEEVASDIHAGLAECLATGTTLIGDISAGGASWEALAAAPVRAVVFREMLGLPWERAQQTLEETRSWLSAHPGTPTCRPGVSPHAPYSVHVAMLSAGIDLGVVSTVHLAETEAERELLTHHTGPFVPFLQEVGVWQPAGLVSGYEETLRRVTGPVPVLLAHGNYLSPQAAIPPNATVVFCPRTHAAFGHAPHPLWTFLRRGLRIALGTDSLASNPDLDLLAEARFLRRTYPEVAGADLLRLATLNGAEALGWHEDTGSLTPGKSADLIVLPLPSGEPNDPHDLLFDSEAPLRGVMCRGRWHILP